MEEQEKEQEYVSDAFDFEYQDQQAAEIQDCLW